LQIAEDLQVRGAQPGMQNQAVIQNFTGSVLHKRIQAAAPLGQCLR
jgi:hypothetical protein